MKEQRKTEYGYFIDTPKIYLGLLDNMYSVINLYIICVFSYVHVIFVLFCCLFCVVLFVCLLLFFVFGVGFLVYFKVFIFLLLVCVCVCV